MTTSSGKLRMLVADDSLTVRKRFVEVLASDPNIEVVAEAEDGRRCIELCRSLRPDVVTLDMMMPVLSGLAATEYIMAYCPTPIVIVSASLNRGEVYTTYQALAAGAVEVIEKPGPSGSGPAEPGAAWDQRLIATVKLVSRVKVITHPRGRLGAGGDHRPQAGVGLGPAPRSPRSLVAIGASTGGPAALLRILSGLPAGFGLPILVVLHITEPFAVCFADWLSDQLPFPVSHASDGERLGAPGECRVLLAPPARHLVVRAGRLHLLDGPERLSCKPSIDVLFESVAAELADRSVACLLTGMGSDGARGLLAVRRAGGLTLAQDEASSVVYGMPREAARLGAAERILPLDAFAPLLAELDQAIGPAAEEASG